MNPAGILLGRCPRCAEGAIFKPGLGGLLGAMNETCAVCGLRFSREQGYFLGAIYVSYGLGVLTVLPVSVVLAIIVDWPLAGGPDGHVLADPGQRAAIPALLTHPLAVHGPDHRPSLSGTDSEQRFGRPVVRQTHHERNANLFW